MSDKTAITDELAESTNLLWSTSHYLVFHPLGRVEITPNVISDKASVDFSYNLSFLERKWHLPYSSDITSLFQKYLPRKFISVYFLQDGHRASKIKRKTTIFATPNYSTEETKPQTKFSY